MRFAAVVCLLLCIAGFAASDASAVTADKAVEAAKSRLSAESIVYEDANIVFDKDGRIWSERGVAVLEGPANPNHGLLPHGILSNKKYDVVLFDFHRDAALKDVWVFVDSETGDVITVYQEI